MKCPLQLLVWKVENKLLKHTSSAQAKRAYSWRNPGQCVCTSLRWHVFLCWVDWLSIIHIIADPGRQQWCADTCTCSSLKVSHFRYVLAWGTSVLLLSTASTGKIWSALSFYSYMFFPLYLSGYLNRLCCVSLFGVGSFNRLASFPLLCTAAKLLAHLTHIISVERGFLPLSQQDDIILCDITAVCFVLCALRLICLTAVQNTCVN